MKNMLKKAVLPVLVLSLVFVMPASAEGPSDAPAKQERKVPGEVTFQIPMNNYCTAENSFDFSFQISNPSDKPEDVVLYLYHRDGSAFNDEGTSFLGMESTIVPGTPFTLQGHATEVYHMNFGNHKKCSERIYLGKIEARSEQVSLLAKGWVNTRSGAETLRSEAIVINDDKQFDLANANAKSENR